MALSEILLALFILNLGTAFGAGLYETRIVLPQWFNKTVSGYEVNVASMRETDTGRKFWGFVTTMPLTLLTIANLVMALQSAEPIMTWWLAASLVTLLERIGTFAFFIPTALQLMKADALPTDQISSKVTWWLRMNYIRNILTLLACLVALRTLILF